MTYAPATQTVGEATGFGGKSSGNLCTMFNDNSTRDAFILGNDTEMYIVKYYRGPWSPLRTLGGSFKLSPTGRLPGDGIDVLGVVENGQMYHKIFMAKRLAHLTARDT